MSYLTQPRFWHAVTQCDKPSQEEVDRMHAIFMREIMALFDAHKHLLPGWEAKQLRVE